MKKLSTKEWIAVSVSVVFVAYMFFGNTVMQVFNQATVNNQTANIESTNSPSGFSVQSEDSVIGTGTTVEAGMQVGINYVLKLTDGTVIQDSNVASGGKPVSFLAGGQKDSVWATGVLGMKVGGKRLIIIPPELGYGSQQVGPIPPNSTLIFEIEVVSARYQTQ